VTKTSWHGPRHRRGLGGRLGRDFASRQNGNTFPGGHPDIIDLVAAAWNAAIVPAPPACSATTECTGMVAITCEGENAFVSVQRKLPERERAGSLHRELQRKSVHARCRWRRLMDRFHQVGTSAAVQFPLCLVHGSPRRNACPSGSA
jgi:hypothetical protein